MSHGEGNGHVDAAGQPTPDDGSPADPAAPAEPSDVFYELVDRAVKSIPEPFASRLGTVAIVIDDEASPEQLASVRAPGLFGLYQGVPRTAYRAEWAQVPSKITIFRRPLEAAYPNPGRLARAVEDTVLHEVAHHFGISDQRLRELRRGQS